MALLDPLLESRNLDALVPELSEKIAILAKSCLKSGIVLGIGCTVRGPEAQAKMWCRPRTPETVSSTRERLSAIAPKLASLLKDEYAGLGPYGSIRLPGESWHQWGEAVDVYGTIGGIASWDGSTQRVIANMCVSIGLFHSYEPRWSWKPISRHWHVQLRREETPLILRGFVDSWKQLETAMAKRFEL